MNKNRKLAALMVLWIIGSVLWGGAASYMVSVFATKFSVVAIFLGIVSSLPFFLAIVILFRFCTPPFKSYGALFLAFLAGSVLLQYLYDPPDRTFTISASDLKAVTENYVHCSGVPQEEFTITVEPVYKKAFHAFRQEFYEFSIAIDGKRELHSRYVIDKSDLKIKCAYRQVGETKIFKSRKVQALGEK